MYLSAFCDLVSSGPKTSSLSDVLRCAVEIYCIRLCWDVWYHDRKLYDIYCTNMFVLVRGITTVNCMISTAQTCSFWSVVSSRTFRRSAASGPRTDYKCCTMCVMIGPWYHDPSLFSFFLLTLFGVSCRDNMFFWKFTQCSILHTRIGYVSWICLVWCFFTDSKPWDSSPWISPPFGIVCLQRFSTTQEANLSFLVKL